MLLRVFILLLLIVGSLSAQTNSQAEPKAPATSTANQQKPTKLSPEKEADIRRLLDVAQVTHLMKTNMDSMQASMRPLLLNAFPPGEYRNKLIDLFFERFRSKADLQQMVDMAVAAYDQHFSDDEIEGLIKFYETPLGKKAVSETPQITAELQERGRHWGEELGRESMQEVLAEHPDLAEAMKAAAAATKLP